EVARLLEAMQRRIDRTFRQVEGAAAALPDLLDDAVAMRRAGCECREHDHVEMAFEHFAFHGDTMPRIARLGVQSCVIGPVPRLESASKPRHTMPSTARYMGAMSNRRKQCGFWFWQV